MEVIEGVLVCALLSFLIINPVTFVDPDLQRRRVPLNLVAVFRESASVDVIDLGNGGERHELDDHINGCVDGAQVDDAGRLRGQTTHSLHEGDEEGTSWIGEVKWLVCDVLHHAEALAHVGFDLQVHEDGADEASAQDGNVGRERDLEAIRGDNRAYERNHEHLEAENE